jgi:hypothetical protein
MKGRVERRRKLIKSETFECEIDDGLNLLPKTNLSNHGIAKVTS